MSNKRIIHCGIMALICVGVFLCTYYCGLFYTAKWFLIGGSVATSLLLISDSFDFWGIKSAMYAIASLVITGIFQNFELYKIIGEKIFHQQMGKMLWGESLMISNCLWFGMILGTVLFSLGVTAILVYRRTHRR